MPNRLKQARERKGLSQAELARLVGVTRQALSSVEANKQDPSLQVALQISRILATDMEELFFEDVAMEKLATKILSKTERLQLVNQYRILQAMHSNDDYLSKQYKRLEEIFERGYIDMYHEAFNDLWDELPPEVTEEVLNILDMHRAMLWSLGQNPSPKDIERVKFEGFDGNNESQQLGFAKFFTRDGDKYKELQIFNSHFPTLQRYRKMLAEWERMGRKPQLTKEQIESILDAGTFKH
ncbi:MAG TPA: YfbU family protein [Oculatellaceae cyanobacterium]